MTPSTLLIFPHQLFINHPGLIEKPNRIFLIEDALFFGDASHPLRFHKQKLWLHRASMKRYAHRLSQAGHHVEYVDYIPKSPVLQRLFSSRLAGLNETILFADVHDYLLSKRLENLCEKHSLSWNQLPTPMFINQSEQNAAYRQTKKRWYMADFYKFQRRRLNVLMNDNAPAGGRWSYDESNRKKVPKKMLTHIPELEFATHDEIDVAAKEYVNRHFSGNPGCLKQLIYPTSHEAALVWLQQFLTQRFDLFGDYEDAMVAEQNWLWHSVLTPMLNIGLLTPKMVLDAALAHGNQHDIPLNSLEGFIRQLIGWREFMRATYMDLGVSMRTANHWNHHRKLPSSFYTGTTGIDPIDDVIKRVLETGYCHHIERLMTLGGFLFLCEIHPDDIYRWFMEMFVDSYDWVMVPNAYAMSQNADGGSITTKPYFSGSSYVRKMSNYPTGDWCKIWDGLYWRWIFKHSDSLGKNPRWAMMCAMARKMNPDKREAHLDHAESFLAQL